MKTRLLLAILAAGALFTAPLLDAAARSSGPSSSSFSSRSSGPSVNWGRTSPTTAPSFKPSTAPSIAPSRSPSPPTVGGVTKPSATPSAAVPSHNPPTVGGVTKPGTTTSTATPPSVGGVTKPGTTPATGTPSRTPPTVGGVTKPGQPQQAATPPTVGGVTKPTPGQPQVAVQAPTQRTQLDRAVAAKASAQSLSAIRANDAKFTKPAPAVSPSAVSNNSVASSYVSSNGPRITTVTYYQNRDGYYRSIGYTPPVYVYQSSPTFGAWDALFWWSILEHSRERERAAMAYHYANDPGYLAWRAEAERLARTNDKLREQLAGLDETSRGMEGPKDPKYLPPGVKPEVALAASVVTGAVVPELTFATGVTKTTYNAVCSGNSEVKGFKAHADEVMKVSCVETAGSGENVEKFAFGRADAALIQSDVMDLMLSTGKVKTFGPAQKTAYLESMWILVRKDSGIKSVTDLKPGVHNIYVGPRDSGTEYSFRNLARHARQSAYVFFSTDNAQYQGVSVKNSSYDDAVSAVLADKNNTMLVLMGGSSEFMKKVNDQFGDKLMLVPLNDWSFTKITDGQGHHVYQECSFPVGRYPRLLNASNGRALCVQSVVVLSEAWIKKYGDTAGDLFLTAWEFTKPDLEKIQGGVK